MSAVRELVHDHAELGARVLAIAALVRGESSPDELADELSELRERLFLHFAREEEALFPFVTEALPELAPQVEAMAIAHDTICGAFARMCHLADRAASPTAIAELFDRFETSYAEHHRSEAALFGALDERLDEAQRRTLADLVAAL